MSQALGWLLANPPKCPDCCIEMDLESKPVPEAESVRFTCSNCGREKVVPTQEITAGE